MVSFLDLEWKELIYFFCNTSEPKWFLPLFWQNFLTFCSWLSHQVNIREKKTHNAMFSVFISNGINIVKEAFTTKSHFAIMIIPLWLKKAHSRLESVNENSSFKEHTLTGIFKTYWNQQLYLKNFQMIFEQVPFKNKRKPQGCFGGAPPLLARLTIAIANF